MANTFVAEPDKKGRYLFRFCYLKDIKKIDNANVHLTANDHRLFAKL